MPGPITHFLFAKHLRPFLLPYFPFLSSYVPYYDAGSLGPDPFFFYGAFSIQNKIKFNTRAFGKQLHLQSPQETFQPLFHHLSQRWMDKNQWLSYLVGFLTHYVLDETLHPYVFYWSGFDEQGGIESMPYKADHIRFEHSLDLAWTLANGIDVQDINPSMTLRKQDDVLITIEKLYQQVYGHGHAYCRSYQSMMQAYDSVYLIKDWKRAVLGSLFSKRSYLYAITHDRSITQEKFTLITNGIQQLWRHPSLGTIHHDDVFTLGVKAEQKFKRLIPILHRLFHSFYPEMIMGALLTEIGQQNFDGDLPHANKLYFQSIYPAYRQQPTWKPYGNNPIHTR